MQFVPKFVPESDEVAAEGKRRRATGEDGWDLISDADRERWEQRYREPPFPEEEERARVREIIEECKEKYGDDVFEKSCQRAEEVMNLTRDDLEVQLLQAEWDMQRLQYDYDMLRRTVDGESS